MFVRQLIRGCPPLTMSHVSFIFWGPKYILDILMLRSWKARKRFEIKKEEMMFCTGLWFCFLTQVMKETRIHHLHLLNILSYMTFAITLPVWLFIDVSSWLRVDESAQSQTNQVCNSTIPSALIRIIILFIFLFSFISVYIFTLFILITLFGRLFFLFAI